MNRSLRLAWFVVVALLLGAGAFGLWHIVVGGLVNGNARAGGFGVGLAVASAALLAAVEFVRRRTAAIDRG